MSTPHVTITLGTQSELERQAHARLLAALHDPRLGRYVQMPSLHLDASAVQSSAFPTPTLGADQLTLQGDALLALFLHGQAHWALNRLPGGWVAVEEVKLLWHEATAGGPPPPQPDPLSQPCASGDPLLHVAVCALQFHGLAELLGKERAREAMSGLPGYGWFDDQMADGPDSLDSYISRHGLTFPPVSADAALPGTQVELEGGPTATLVSGDPTETELAERLTDLHQRFDLRPWMFSPHVELDGARPPSSDGPAPRISPFFLRLSDEEVLLNYLQLQAMWQAGRLDGARLEEALSGVLPADVEVSSAVPVSIVLGCAVALHGLQTLIGSHAAAEAAYKHPRNGALYVTLAPALGAIRQAVGSAGIDSTLWTG